MSCWQKTTTCRHGGTAPLHVLAETLQPYLRNVTVLLTFTQGLYNCTTSYIPHLLGLYADVRRRIPGWLCWRKKPIRSGGERLSIERARISEETSRISVESRYNYRTLARLLTWLAVSFLAGVRVWVKMNVEKISRVDLGSAPCAATWFSFIVAAWIIDEGFLRRTSTYKPSNTFK